MSLTREQNSRVWAGDESVIAKVKEAYRSENATLSSFVSTLYSFRKRDEILALIPDIKKAVAETSIEPDPADVLSAVLLWAGQTDLAEQVVTNGLKRVRKLHKKGDHTMLLLELTWIQIQLGKEHKLHVMRRKLVRISEEAGAVKDHRQQNRIRRKAGWLKRRSGMLATGTWDILSSIFMPNIPLAVRGKSAVALFAL